MLFKRLTLKLELWEAAVAVMALRAFCGHIQSSPGVLVTPAFLQKLQCLEKKLYKEEGNMFWRNIEMQYRCLRGSI